MHEAPTLLLEETEPTDRDLHLLIAPEPWYRVFAENVRNFFQRTEVLDRQSAITNLQSITFWPDVFVDRGLPWRRFLQSGACHVLVLAIIWAGSRLLALQPHVSQPAFTRADVVYYTPSEYLPPLDTRLPNPAHAREADPEYSAQPIISVPPRSR